MIAKSPVGAGGGQAHRGELGFDGPPVGVPAGAFTLHEPQPGGLVAQGRGRGTRRAHPLGAAAEASLRLTALTPVRCFVIGRRERTLLREIAPKLTHVPRVTAPGPAPDRPAAGHDASGTRRLVVLSGGSDAK